MGLGSRVVPVGIVLAAVGVAAQVAVAARPMRVASRAADSVAVSVGRWSIVPTPTTAGQSGYPALWRADLAGVSCVSAVDCTAVGTKGNSTLVEQWDGTVWSIIPSPKAPRVAPHSFNGLSGVSCVSATDCTAVGGAGNGYVGSTLAEHWNGTEWSIVPSPKPATNSGLAGVSCVSATDCTAVGYANGHVDATLVEHWNGTKWSRTPSPNPADGGSLRGVSCVSARDCTAVGWVFNSNGNGTATLVEHWNGTKWSRTPSPNPAEDRVQGNPQAELEGVFCVSAVDCAAVGDYGIDRADRPLVEQWNGKKWSIHHSPNPARESSLRGVSCASRRDCTAVGGDYKSSGNMGSTLVEHWNGKRWSIIHAPKPAGSGLSGVSCVSATHCTAVGTALGTYSGNRFQGALVEQEG